ncbi:MAG: glycosyltransferase [Myxococcota bacterium]
MDVVGDALLGAALLALLAYGVGFACTAIHLHRALLARRDRLPPMLGARSTPRTTPTRLDVHNPSGALPDEPLPPISLLKPLKGLEEELETNLRSYYEQDYPVPFEIVFATTEPRDPGLVVAQKVAADYPRIQTRFVRSNPNFGLNPKVANLSGALSAAQHDLVFQSDANVRISSGYLRKLVNEMRAAEASLVTSLITGVGERSVGAAMENLQLSAHITPDRCAALHIGGVPCVVGKSMLLHAGELRELGGLACVRNVLCEDFILGARYRNAGKRVLLSATMAQNVNRDISIRQFLSRHSRWLKMRAVIHRGSFVAELLSNPVALATIALPFSGGNAAAGGFWAAVVLAKMVGDASLLRLTRGNGMHPSYLVVVPFKDLLMAFVWVHSLFSRSVRWRGRKLRFGAGSRLREDDGTLPLRVLRRLFGFRK